MAGKVGLSVASLAALLGLVLLSAQGILGAAAALVLAVGITSIVVLGPERLGGTLMLLAMFTAPQNSVRPIAGADFVTFSDIFFALGAGLLLPVMLQRRSRYPLGWLVGSVIVIVMVFVASTLSPTPLLDFTYGLRLPAAAVALPFVFLAWSPTPKQIDRMAWAYVAGHLLSTAYAFAHGKEPITGRYQGLTTHYNFFGISAVIATGLLIHLFHRVPRHRRWMVWGAGLVVFGSVLLSGSRAAALVVVMMGLLYPLLERSILSAYLLVAGAMGMVLAGNTLLVKFGSGSAFARLKGDSTTSYSDNVRTTALNTGWSKFLAKPFTGNGFDLTALDAHNIYLEVAIGIGVIGLIGHLLILATGTLPMLRQGPLHRLGYVTFGYAAVGMLTNSLWDRFVWMAISLAILAAAAEARERAAHPPVPAGRRQLPVPTTRPSRDPLEVR